MQYTYEEAVRELSDFLGKYVTADNYWKMEQIFLTVLKGDRSEIDDYQEGYNVGYEMARSIYDPYYEE